jgi:transposase
LGKTNGLFNRAIFEKLDRDQLITLLLAATERINVLERTIIELGERIAELEGRLNQNSSNSSKPPSSDVYSKPAPKSQRKKSGKKPGGQQGHTGHGKPMAEEAAETKVITPQTCTCCGESLRNVREHKTQTH